MSMMLMTRRFNKGTMVSQFDFSNKTGLFAVPLSDRTCHRIY